MPHVKIRRAKADDVEAILDLWHEMMSFHARLDRRFCPTPDGREHFRCILLEWMQQTQYCVLVAESGNRLVGYTIGRLAENPPVLSPPLLGHVSDICVSPPWRRQGVARRLFLALRKWMLKQGATVVQLHVAARNPDAQAFWRQMGFSPFMTRMWLDLEARGDEAVQRDHPASTAA